MSAEKLDGGDGLSAKDQQEIDRLDWGRLADWMQLVRLPTVFTLISNTVAAGILTGSKLIPLTGFIPLLCASISAYWAGMILNDVVDLEADKEHRPRRPLPAGRVSPAVAGHVGNALLMLTPLLVLGITAFHTTDPLWQGAAFVCAALLSLCVRAYNSPLKQTPLGPLLMGSCRALNVLMVGCCMVALVELETFPMPVVYFAAAIGVYILGVTVYAFEEEHVKSSLHFLIVGILFQMAGMVLVACLPYWSTTEIPWTLSPTGGFPLLIGLIAITVLHRSGQGVMHPVSRKIQLGVKHSILTLILVDAAVVAMWAGPWWGTAVALLLFPALSSALRLRTT